MDYKVKTYASLVLTVQMQCICDRYGSVTFLETKITEKEK